MFKLMNYMPLFLLIIVLCATTYSILPANASVPAWIENKNSCLVFQMVYNRSYSSSTESGQSTDFTEPYECVLWCGWVQSCVGILWVHQIETAYGGCYDVTRPCCKIYTEVDPEWGYPQNNYLQDTAIMEWYAPPLPYNLSCDPVKQCLDMEPYVGPPYIWYDYMYESDAVGRSNVTLSEASTEAPEEAA